MFSHKDVPAEVKWVWSVKGSNILVGAFIHDQCLEIIYRYPEYFEWEHKYAQIPKEVHEDYFREIYPDWDKPLVLEKAKEPQPIVLKSKYSDKELWEMINEFIEDKNREEQKVFEERKRKEEIWDKHYKKYGLEYRP